MIIGTAGHIDHGKTALVQALTGVDTDRLPEEKRRGITIELGFAPLELEGVGTVGIVDVPGHEAFVRTMLAGATGIDLAMLVVAADEGAMPQTREHLAILDLLGVSGGIVVLTKRDLVDDEWLELVTEDVRSLLRGSALETAEIVSASAQRGEGLDEVRAALTRAARAIPQRAADDLFRLPVDRAFSVRGTGTVVTGTVWSGTLLRDQVVRIMVGGRTARVRSLQHHGATVDRVIAGQRAAIALVGVDVGDVPRGSVLVSDAAWIPTTIIRADVALLPTAERALDARTSIRFHLGTSDVAARVVGPSAGLRSGARVPARVILETPVLVRAGDRFVLRTPSPATTVGGGVVQDPLPPHRRAKPFAAPPTVAAAMHRLLAEAGWQGVDVSVLPIRLGASPSAIERLIEGSAGDALRIGGRLYSVSAAADLRTRLEVLVNAHHVTHPLDPGVSLQSVRGAVIAAAELIDAAVALAVGQGSLTVEAGVVRAGGWKPSLTSDEEVLRDVVADTIRTAGREPPSVEELVQAHGPRVTPLLRLLDRGGAVVAVEPNRYYDTGVIERLIGELKERMSEGREYPPGEMRELLGVSRKYLIPLLEYCDRRGVTDRRGSGRILAGKQDRSNRDIRS
jgi:selenocysteine-specific elongation factor